MQKVKDTIKNNKKKIFGVISILFTVLIVYKIYTYIRDYINPTLVNGIKDAKTELVIPSGQLPKSSNGIEYTYSFWVFVDDWNYKYGKNKNVIFRKNNLQIDFYPKNNNLMIRVDDNSTKDKYVKESTTGTYNNSSKIGESHMNLDLSNCMQYCNDKSDCAGISYANRISRDKSGAPSDFPDVFSKCVLYNNTNSLKSYDNDSKQRYLLNTANSYKKISKKQLDTKLPCDIKKIPLQRWVHVCVTLWNRTLDVYVNGKLKRSCILDSIPKNEVGDLYINKNGGYSGYISNLKYFPYPLSVNKIYYTYLKGKKTLNLISSVGKFTSFAEKIKGSVNIDVDVNL